MTQTSFNRMAGRLSRRVSRTRRPEAVWRQCLRPSIWLFGMVAAILPGAVVATAQEPDRIIIEGTSHSLHTNPLAGLLEARKWEPPGDAVRSSANWRGYVATWAVEQGQLVLKDMTVSRHGPERGQYETVSQMATLFPAGGRVVATWYSGALVVPEGDVVEYQHMGYGSVFERYQVLRVSEGVITGHLRMTGEAFQEYKASQWDAYRQTDHYRKAYDELRASQEDWSEDLVEEFLRGYYAEHYLNQ